MRNLIKSLSNYISFIEAVGLLLAMLFFAIAITIDNLVIKGIISSISASFFFLFCMEFIQNRRIQLEKYRFKMFFGKDVLNNEMYLVYPVFILSNQIMDFIKEQNLSQVFQKNDSSFGNVHRIDLPSAVADNDLRALTYLTGLFGEISKMTPPIMVDYDVVKKPTRSFISFGLASNDCTHMYFEREANPAFKLVSDSSNPDYLLVYDSQGNEYKFTSTENICYGIIMKYHPDPQNYPNRIWFYCAGLGACATPGSALYLANNWENLYKEVGSLDFIAVIKVYNYSEYDPFREILIIK